MTQGGPVRVVTTQYRETDWAFAQRLNLPWFRGDYLV
ncbi:MAG: hypothetical protein KGL57_00225 [Burkholderiales bacterium]|nr:hypothetical protein [Burkholderiales bacterium]